MQKKCYDEFGELVERLIKLIILQVYKCRRLENAVFYYLEVNIEY